MKKIIIIGGGIGGLCTAIALQQYGFEVKVYERVRKLGEVARVEIAPEDDRNASRSNRRRVGTGRPRRTMAAAEVVHADNEKLVCIKWLARADDVVPPANIVRLVGIMTGDVMVPR